MTQSLMSTQNCRLRSSLSSVLQQGRCVSEAGPLGDRDARWGCLILAHTLTS